MNETDQAGGATAQTPDASQETSQSSQQNAGLEARIAELTHGMREAQRSAAASQELVLAQQAETRRLQEMLAAPRPQAEPEVDLSNLGDAGSLVRKAIDDAVKRTTDTLNQQFQSQFKQLQSVQVQGQVASIAAQYGLSPEVVAHAQSVMVGATQRGVPMVPEDAVKWALGEAMMTGKVTPAQLQRKPGPNGNVLIGAAPAPFAPQRAPAMPANFENLAPDEQAAWAAKNGLGDISLD